MEVERVYRIGILRLTATRKRLTPHSLILLVIYSANDLFPEAPTAVYSVSARSFHYDDEVAWSTTRLSERLQF